MSLVSARTMAFRVTNGEGNKIQGNYVGTDSTGRNAKNLDSGILLDYGANGTIIGGTTGRKG